MLEPQDNRDSERRIKAVILLLDRAMNELDALGIDVPASYVAIAHDLLVERLFSHRARPHTPRRLG